MFVVSDHALFRDLARPPWITSTLRRHARVIVLFAVATVAAALLYHPPLAVATPGPTIDVTRDITITGVPTYPTTGRYLLATVRFERPALAGVALAALLSVRAVVSVDPDRAWWDRQHRLFQDSRVTAATAATSLLVPSRDASPMDIRFRRRNIMGESAGLIYALAIADMLDKEDVARGRTIAASGVIGVDGRVRAVGGMTQKSAAVERLGPDLFLVPEDNVFDAWKRLPDAQSVATLSDALSIIRGG